MADNAKQSLQSILRFIQSQLDHPPIGPNESAAEFKSLFHELAEAVQAGHRSAAEFVMLLQATILTFRIMGLERIRSAIVQHMRPEVVVALIRLADGEAERGSIVRFEVYDRRKEYFANRTEGPRSKRGSPAPAIRRTRSISRHSSSHCLRSR